MNPKNNCLVNFVFTAILMAVFIHVAPCAAQVLSGSGLELVNDDDPRIAFRPNVGNSWFIEADQSEFNLRTFDQSLNFEIISIKNDARRNALTLRSQGVLITSEFSDNPNELEIQGDLSNDFYAAVAVTPDEHNGSVRIGVNTSVNAWGIDARGASTNGGLSGQDFYQSVIRSSLDAPTNTISMDRFGYVGIGGVPFEELEADLHIDGREILFDPSGPLTWRLYADDDEYFQIRHHDKISGLRTDPFTVLEAPDDSVVIDTSGDVGLGTFTPDSALHIYRGGLYGPQTPAAIKVEDANTTTANRDLMELVNNGGVRFVMDNQNANERWEFSNNSIGDFNVNRTGTGGPEMRVTRAGRMTSGPAGFAALDSRPNGNLFIAGTLFESSDRDKKENFEVVDCDAILKQVVELPITTWNYKSDEQEIRHMGPVAQDFRKAFKLGDSDKTIATTDKVGVSIAAIKALNSKLQEKDEEIHSLRSSLKAEIQEKDSQIETLENRAARAEDELNKMADRMEKFEAMLEASLR